MHCGHANMLQCCIAVKTIGDKWVKEWAKTRRDKRKMKRNTEKMHKIYSSTTAWYPLIFDFDIHWYLIHSKILFLLANIEWIFDDFQRWLEKNQPKNQKFAWNNHSHWLNAWAAYQSMIMYYAIKKSILNYVEMIFSECDMPKSSNTHHS